MQLTKSVKALFFALAGVLLNAGCGGKAGDRPSPSAMPKTASEALPRWQPEEKLLDQLAEEASVDVYSVRPPKGYVWNPPPPRAPAGMKGWAWTGALRDDQSASQFMIGIVTPPPGDTEKLNVQDYLDKMLEGIKRQRTDWTQTAVERGQINGLIFFRAYWTGIEPQRQRKMHGFMYVCQQLDKFIHLSSQDVEPNHEQALKIAEAAALTFKQR